MKEIIFIFLISMTTSSIVANQDMYEKKYECLTEARVSGLFQFERKNFMVGFLNTLIKKLNNYKTKSTWYLDVDPKNLN